MFLISILKHMLAISARRMHACSTYPESYLDQISAESAKTFQLSLLKATFVILGTAGLNPSMLIVLYGTLGSQGA